MKRNFKRYRIAVYEESSRYYPEEGGYYVPYNYVAQVGYTDDLEEAIQCVKELAETYDCEVQRPGFAIYESRYIGEGCIIAIESRYDSNFPRPNAHRIPYPGVYC